MHYRRFFIVFFISILLFLLFVLSTIYLLLLKDINRELYNIQYHKVKTAINALYITQKYDLQNVIRDNNYEPISAVYVYNKAAKSLNFFKGKDILKIHFFNYINDNVNNVVFLDDGFGYILPLIRDKYLFTILAIEKGEDIFISVNYYSDTDKNSRFCLVAKDYKSDSMCEKEKFIGVYEQKFFSIKYSFEIKQDLRLILLYIVLLIVVGGFLSFWVSRHFDIEERRILLEIQNSIDAVHKEYLPLISIKSIYPSYNKIIEQINNLIQKLKAEIDKHKVVYNKHFQEVESNKAIDESLGALLNYFITGCRLEDYKDIIKSFDLLLKKDGGGVRYKGVFDNPVLFKKMIFVMLELISFRNGYNIIIEAGSDKICIISEGDGFDSFGEMLVFRDCKDIHIEGKRIIIL